VHLVGFTSEIYPTSFTSLSQCWSVVFEVFGSPCELSIWSSLEINLTSPIDSISQNTWRLFVRYETSYQQQTFTLLKQPAITSVEVISRSQLDESVWHDHFVNSVGKILCVVDEMNRPNCLICSLSANWLLKYNLEADMPLDIFYATLYPQSQFVLPLED
jgi:hypothetical protein